jgi:DNA processing protein
VTQAYPEALARIPDAPPILWALGDTSCMARPMVAIVGTRNASALGARMARRLTRELGEAGFVVVSGLARGIDALAHEAALETGTIAVHAGGLDVLYPAENAGLADQIGKTGLRLSEMPFGLQPQGRHFPRRNRIVSGLAEAVIVVEAAARSGSLITARCALDQGREVMAVPGHPLDSRASGGNILLRDGATLVRGADDVIEALGGAPEPRSDTRPRSGHRARAQIHASPLARRRGRGARSAAPECHAARRGSADPRHRAPPPSHRAGPCHPGNVRTDQPKPRRVASPWPGTRKAPEKRWFPAHSPHLHRLAHTREVPGTAPRG